MDQLPGGGLWSTMDHGQRRSRSSPKCGLAGATAVRSSPRLHQNEEGVSAVLTVVFGDRGNDGGRPVTGRNKQQRSSSEVG
jgi:hypothetical protein